MQPGEENRSTQAFRLRAFSGALLRDCRGQGLVEYLLALALVAFGSVAAEQAFACRLSCAAELVANQIERVMLGAKKIPPGQLKKCSKTCG
jgi:hypothetical protein